MNLQNRTEQAEANVSAIREKLARNAREYPFAELADIVNEMAAAQGEYETYTRVLRAESYLIKNGNLDQVEETVRNVSTDLLLNGADDNWSGRGNDAQRARFDGVREAVRQILDK